MMMLPLSTWNFTLPTLPTLPTRPTRPTLPTLPTLPTPHPHPPPPPPLLLATSAARVWKGDTDDLNAKTKGSDRIPTKKSLV